jgi:SNF2 family DNA or RNA helicase
MDLGDRVVVFSQFKGPLIELEERLNRAGISAVRFDGDTPEKRKEEVRFDFDRSRCNAEGYEKKWQVVLANYKTGGVGLNFTDATQMVILDSEWNGGKEDQAFGRIDRMGQTEETTVHMLNIDGTIDSWMRDLVTSKREMVEGFETTADLAQALLAAIHAGEVM